VKTITRARILPLPAKLFSKLGALQENAQN